MKFHFHTKYTVLQTYINIRHHLVGFQAVSPIKGLSRLTEFLLEWTGYWDIFVYGDLSLLSGCPDKLS